LAKMCWAAFWATFSANSSGHPEADGSKRAQHSDFTADASQTRASIKAKQSLSQQRASSHWRYQVSPVRVARLYISIPILFLCLITTSKQHIS
jgi:hypothetical protein